MSGDDKTGGGVEDAELVPDPRAKEGEEIVPGGDDDLPVVARMVVEVRSDGRRTVARGAVEDLATGQKVAVEARGSTPIALAGSLAKAVFRLPSLAKTTVRALLPGRSKRRR